MIVLLDLEWIEKGEKYLTQLSAVRTDSNWNPIASLEIFVKPAAVCFKEPGHVAFGGHSIDLYKNAFPESEAIQDFNDWLEPDDEVWVWAKTNLQYLSDLWNKHLGGFIPKTRATANKVRDLAVRGKRAGGNLYAILACYGGLPPYPEHLASNDTETMRQLFITLGITPALFAKKPPKAPAPRPSQREKNQRTIDKSQYNYLFLKGSEVFHRRECKICLSAQSEGNILGSVHYETAAREHRPCRLCKPIPFLFTAPISDAELSRKEREKTGADSKLNNEIIKAKMLGGEVVSIKRGKIVGWCHHKMHKGAVNKAILKEHDCLGKNCPYLERNCQSPFWAALEIEKESKEKRKAKLRAEKIQRAIEEADLKALSESWQSYLDDMESDMMIVRVAKDAPSVYRIFYVSDNRFADGNRYPDFLETLKFVHPHYRINLRHIRDVDGHFVTTDEYLTRPRK